MSGTYIVRNKERNTSLALKIYPREGQRGGVGQAGFSERSYLVSAYSAKSLMENTDSEQWERNGHCHFYTREEEKDERHTDSICEKACIYTHSHHMMGKLAR